MLGWLSYLLIMDNSISSESKFSGIGSLYILSRFAWNHVNIITVDALAPYVARTFTVMMLIIWISSCLPGAISINRWCLTTTRIPIIKIRQSHNRHIFIPGKTVFISKSGPTSDLNVRVKLFTNFNIGSKHRGNETFIHSKPGVEWTTHLSNIL